MMNLFRFEHPEFLYGLLLLPVLTGIYFYHRWRRKIRLKRYGDLSLLQSLMPGVSVFRPGIKFVLRLLAFGILVLCLAGPQFGSRLEEVKRKGIEMVIALDVSNSMLAEDLSPNRLERAKQAINRLVDRMNEDNIGLIVFAGNAYTQLPVTNDYASAKMFLSNVSPQMVSRQGTAIGEAIDHAQNSFSPSLESSKVIIVITDGENHEGDAVARAREAHEKGIIIHTIGLGSPQGAPVPLKRGGQTTYLKDREGNTVVSQLNEQMLQEIAAAGNGKYIRATNTSLGLTALFSDLQAMEEQELEGQVYAEYDHQFQIPAMVVLLLLLADSLIRERKNRRLQNVRIYDMHM